MRHSVRSLIVFVCAMLGLGLVPQVSAVAAPITVRMLIDGDLAQSRLVEVGHSRAGFSADVTAGLADSFRWWSEDESLLTVSSSSGAAVSITGVAAGATRLWLEAKSGSDTSRVSCWVSIYVEVPDTAGAVLRSGAEVWLTSSTASGSSRGVQVNPPKVVVHQKGNGWFRIEFPSSWTFPENDYLASRLAWARASDLQIPPNSIELDAAYVNVEKGVDKTLHATVLEDYANDVTMSWTASDTAVASVSGTGRVVAKIEGTSRVTVKAASSHGVEVTDSALVSVYTPISEDTVGKTTKAVSLFRGAVSSSPVLASLSSGAQVSITGVSGEFWLVEVDGRTGFVAKNLVTIPVVAVVVSPNQVQLAVGASAQLHAVVKPANATDKSVKWSSVDAGGVSVDASGLVKAKKQERQVKITATAGGVSGVADVVVAKSKSDVVIENASPLPGWTGLSAKAAAKFVTFTATAAEGATSVMLSQVGGSKLAKTCTVSAKAKKCVLVLPASKSAKVGTKYTARAQSYKLVDQVKKRVGSESTLTRLVGQPDVGVTPVTKVPGSIKLSVEKATGIKHDG